MELEHLFPASWHCLVITALIAAVFLLIHKRKSALRIFTVGVYLALTLLFVLKSQITNGTLDVYMFLVAAYDSLDVFKLGYGFEHFSEFTAQVLGTDYRTYAAFLFVLAPVLTISNVLSFFQTTIDRLRYSIFPGTKYILSELNAESVALAESIREEHSCAQIVFTSVGDPEKKNDTKLLERARELGALCLKKDVTRLCYKTPLRTNRIYLISCHESKNVSDALALIEKYKNSFSKMDIYVFASSHDSKLAIDRADKGTHCLHPEFKSDLKKQLSLLLKDSAIRNWKGFANALETVHLEGRFTVRCVDVAELTVRDVLKEHYKTIHDLAKEKEHVISITILGFGKHGAALLKNAAWIFQFYGYKLQFNVVDIDGKAYKYLQQEAPELLCDYSKECNDDSSHDIHFWGQDQGINCLCSDFDELFLQTFWTRFQSTQMVFISLGDDSKNIAAAIHIRQLFQRKDIEAELKKVNFTGTGTEDEKIVKELEKKFDDPNNISSPLIFAVVNDSRRANNLIDTAKGDNSHTKLTTKLRDAFCQDKKGQEPEKESIDQMRCDYHIHPVATLCGTYDIKKLRELQNLEKSALKNHLCWSFKDVLDSDTHRIDEETWDKLVENAEKYMQYSYYRSSSVTTALHQQLLKEVKEELDQLATEQKLDVREIKKITEHMRWNAYMRTQGYQFLGVRNDQAKFHNLIVPYHLLPKKEKEKDLFEF